MLRAFCSSALWQIYETLYLLFRVQECRFTPPPQDAGIIMLSMEDGILTHLLFRFPDPTLSFSFSPKPTLPTFPNKIGLEREIWAVNGEGVTTFSFCTKSTEL
jgi:hypothetical protein